MRQTNDASIVIDLSHIQIVCPPPLKRKYTLFLSPVLNTLTDIMNAIAVTCMRNTVDW